MSTTDTLLCFCKHPTAGLVKSRLAKSTGEEQAAEVYKRLLSHTLRNAKRTELEVILYCHPDTHHPILQELANLYELNLYAQSNGNLGDKMQDAINKHLTNNSNVVLIGTDCPQLEPEYILKAFSQLSSGKDIVFGPTEDGGYALIGMNKCHPEIFSNINWGTATVLNETKTRCANLNLKYFCLDTVRDLDDIDDYKYFSEHKDYQQIFNLP